MHPYLIAFSSILFIYSNNFDKVKLVHALSLGCISLVTIWVALKLLNILTKYNEENAFLISTFVLFASNYGKIYDVIPGIQIGHFIIGRNKVLLVIYAVLLIFAIFIIYKSGYIKHNLIAIKKFFHTVGLVLCGFPLLAISFNFINNSTSKEGFILNNANKFKDSIIIEHNLPQKRPNVVFIIFDSYVRGNILKEYYNFDNSSILNYLGENGFHVDTCATSNYPFTIFALNSLLNMNYIHLTSEYQKTKNKAVFLSQALDNNQVTTAFKKHGYTIITYRGWAENSIKECNNLWDRHIATLVLNELTLAIVHTSILRVIERELIAGPLRRDLGFIVNGIMQKNKKEPYFLFAHIICPHPPYIFRVDGGKPSIFKSVWQRSHGIDGYVDQVQFVNSQIKKIVDFYNDGPNKDETMIIMQADYGHGYALGDYLVSDKKPPADFLKAQFQIVHAYRLPEAILRNMYSGITPVNEFRVLLNGIFNMQLPLLPDSSYFTKINEPYNFYNVTVEIKN